MAKFIKIMGTSHTSFPAEEYIINIEQITAIRKSESNNYSYFVNLAGGPDIYIDKKNANLLFAHIGISL